MQLDDDEYGGSGEGGIMRHNQKIVEADVRC